MAPVAVVLVDVGQFFCRPGPSHRQRSSLDRAVAAIAAAVARLLAHLHATQGTTDWGYPSRDARRRERQRVIRLLHAALLDSAPARSGFATSDPKWGWT